MPWEYGWKPYVTVKERRAQAEREMRALVKKGHVVQPILIDGRRIVNTFWGSSWCTHLESFSDFENRLPRGRTYVRNGSVCHLEIASGQILALVSGSAIYEVKIRIDKLADDKWSAVKQQCTGKIGTLLELLQGNLSDSVMTVVTHRQTGLFPLPNEIAMDCTCPDYASMCKHIAAVLYGVGARLDQSPELLFLLRGVDHQELVFAEASATRLLNTDAAGSKRRRLDESALADVFGIDMVADEQSVVEAIASPVPKRTSTANSKEQRLTGKTIRDLRARLKMSRLQFATLVGVSSTSVSNWESNRGTLSLSPTSRSAVLETIALSEKRAWSKLRRLENQRQ